MADDIEKILIKKAKQLNMEAFEKLITSNERGIYNIAYRMFNNEEDAKDITQEVFIKIFKNLNKFDENSKFSTWIHRITINTCIDEIRKRKGKDTDYIDELVELDEGSMKKQYINNSITPEESLIKNEETQLLKQSISSLSEVHKTLIILRDIRGFSYNEIAEITNNSLGTVKSRLARARTQLKNIILESKELSNRNKRLKSTDDERRS